MARGGKRPGAGRPKGAISKSTRTLLEATKSKGETPLAYVLRIMRDQNAPSERRDHMASLALPFCHPRLNAVEHAGKDGGPIRISITGREANY